MDNTWKQIIEGNISEYISKIDFRHPDFNIKELKKELKKLIGSEPAIKLKWHSTEKINELLKDSGAVNYKEVIEKIEQIDIIYLDSENKPHTFKLII